MKPNFQNYILQATGAESLYHIEDIQSLWSDYGKIMRYGLRCPDCERVVVKHVKLPDSHHHPRGWNTDRSHQRKIRSYQVETAWYRDWWTQVASESFSGGGSHIVTPAQRGKTHYFWGAAFDVPDLPKDTAEKTKASVIAAFDEDKHLLEKIQRQVTDDPRGMDYLEVTLGADSAGMRVRQILNKKLAAEGRSL